MDPNRRSENKRQYPFVKLPSTKSVKCVDIFFILFHFNFFNLVVVGAAYFYIHRYKWVVTDSINFCEKNTLGNLVKANQRESGI